MFLNVFILFAFVQYLRKLFNITTQGRAIKNMKKHKKEQIPHADISIFVMNALREPLNTFLNVCQYNLFSILWKKKNLQNILVTLEHSENRALLWSFSFLRDIYYYNKCIEENLQITIQEVVLNTNRVANKIFN